MVDRWLEIKPLLIAVLQQPPPQRMPLVVEMCGDDSHLRDELLQLVAALPGARGNGKRSTMRFTEPVEAMTGKMLDAYRLERKLGEGGMGVVFLATRQDGQFEKQVAIKIIRHDLVSDELLLRFHQERQALAKLEHPNIARLLDSGVSEAGRHFIVMEYVDGIAIDRYCWQRQLNLRERLLLFRKVLAAVHYAHQRLIVHRDLKPANILVTPEGEPKLLDFGIAKLLPSENTLDTLQLTTVHMPKTPAYASPEQMSHLPITTYTDVYSLGVLLYQLLTGQLPYRLASEMTPAMIQQIICDQEPRKPSTVVAENKNLPVQDAAPNIASHEIGHGPKWHQITGDLDNIILMALHKKPERRYASAEQFSEDLWRHLEHLPVAARKDSYLYRTRKFVRRHVFGVIVTGIIALLLLAFVVATRQQSAQIVRERDKAQRTADFLVSIFRINDPSETRGESVTARAILDSGAARIEKELAAAPLVQAHLMNIIGSAYGTLGLLDKATPHLERAVALQRDSPASQPLDLALSLNDLGVLHRMVGRYDQAESCLREALAIRQQHLDKTDPDVAISQANLGVLLFDRGTYAEAESLYLAGLPALRLKYPDGHESLGGILYNLALIEHERGNNLAAKIYVEEVHEMVRRLYGENSPYFTHIINLQAKSALSLGDFVAADSLYREGIELGRRVYGEEHPTIGVLLGGWGTTQLELGNLDEAGKAIGQALKILQQQLESTHYFVLITKCRLARWQIETGRVKDAQAISEELIGTAQALPKLQPNTLVSIQTTLASTLLANGKSEEAEKWYRTALALKRDKVGESHPEIADILRGAAAAAIAQQKFEDADTLLQQAHNVLLDFFPPDHWRLAEVESMLGECRFNLGMTVEAEMLMQESYHSLRKALGEDSRRTQLAREKLRRYLKVEPASQPQA